MNRIQFALNHMTAPRLKTRALIDLAAALGCFGVELRNDLADKGLTNAALFDGQDAEAIGAYAKSKNIKILGLSEVYGFNHWSDDSAKKINTLIVQAKACGAQSISLIPLNDGRPTRQTALADLTHALTQILPIVQSANMIALIEPLGFPTASIHRKADVIEAINAADGEAYFKLVHDTFHHHLAGEAELFGAETGIVHISGVIDPSLSKNEMQDQHRILVDANDRLGSIEQIKALLNSGYDGAFSFEPFSPDVHQLDDIETALRESMDFIRNAIST